MTITRFSRGSLITVMPRRQSAANGCSRAHPASVGASLRGNRRRSQVAGDVPATVSAGAGDAGTVAPAEDRGVTVAFDDTISQPLGRVASVRICPLLP